MRLARKQIDPPSAASPFTVSNSPRAATSLPAGHLSPECHCLLHRGEPPHVLPSPSPRATSLPVCHRPPPRTASNSRLPPNPSPRGTSTPACYRPRPHGEPSSSSLLSLEVLVHLDPRGLGPVTQPPLSPVPHGRGPYEPETPRSGPLGATPSRSPSFPGPRRASSPTSALANDERHRAGERSRRPFPPDPLLTGFYDTTKPDSVFGRPLL